MAVWSPPASDHSGLAGFDAEQLAALARHHEVVVVIEGAPGEVASVLPDVEAVSVEDRPAVDLDLYHLDNTADHVYVYRAALARPGVVVMSQWVLHDLVWSEARQGGDVSRYLREMRRSHGPTGTLVGRQVARGLGGAVLPTLYAVNDRVLEGSLGVVATTRETESRVRQRRPGVPLVLVPPPAPPAPVPELEPARVRRELGLPVDGLIVTAPGLATTSRRIEALFEAAGRIRSDLPSLHLVLAGAVDPALAWHQRVLDAGLGDAVTVTGPLDRPELLRHLAASDVVSTLRFPCRGRLPANLVQAMRMGRPALVTAGTPAAEEMPEGTVAPVDPGRREGEELASLLRRLLESGDLRSAIGRAARHHVLEHHDLAQGAARLAAFLEDIQHRRGGLLREIMSERAEEGTITAYFIEEVRQAARELGIAGLPLGLEPLLSPLARGSDG